MSSFMSRITEMMEDQFDLKPKARTTMYRRPYPEWMDAVALPNRYRIPEFSKFSGQDSVTTMEHISRYDVQLGEAASQEALRVRLFSLSPSGSAFSWFASLAPCSIQSWADPEKRFHSYFYTGVTELS